MIFLRTVCRFLQYKQVEIWDTYRWQYSCIFCIRNEVLHGRIHHYKVDKKMLMIIFEIKIKSFYVLTDHVIYLIYLIDAKISHSLVFKNVWEICILINIKVIIVLSSNDWISTKQKKTGHFFLLQ